MSKTMVIDLPHSEIAAHLISRYGRDSAPGGATAYVAASAVAAAVHARAAAVPALEVLAALLLVPDAREELDRVEVGLIEAVLDRGVTWDELGAVYGGRTRQSMRDHYRRRGGRRTWAPGRFPVLSEVGDDTDDEFSRQVDDVHGTWQVRLRRGCRPGDAVLDEVVPVIAHLEQSDVRLLHRPWPEWFTGNRRYPRRVRSAVHSFERVADDGSTVVLRASSAVSAE